MRSLPFLIGEAFANLRRHGLMTVAAVSTIAVALALLGTFAVTFYELDTASRRAVADFEMRVFCRRELQEETVKEVGKRLRELPGVGVVQYLSSEQIWKEQTANYPIDTTGIPNQMPDTFVVKLEDAKQSDAVARAARSWTKEVEAVSVPEQELGVVSRIADFLRTLGIVGGVVLVLGALTVVSNTIRISVFSRRREIKIMQIVGAAPWFIRLPMVIEGLIHGLIGGALASVALALIGRSVGALIGEELPQLLSYGAPIDLLDIALLTLVAGALVGVMGSLLSIRRYLRVV
jgi:cell division transport system permease protein